MFVGPPLHVEHSSILNDASREALERYVGALLQWNRRINLVARGDERHLWTRHIEDSLQLAPLVPSGVSHAIDLGSGAGFPGLPLAVATRIPFHLLESDQRKAAFLREAARMTGAPITVVAMRIENATIPRAPLITARALAPLPDLLQLAAPLLTSGGVCLFLKGTGVDTELTTAAREWHMQVERFPSRTAPQATILRISDLARARI